MTNKTYKAIFVPEKLHHKIKKLALENKVTMIDFLEVSSTDFEIKYKSKKLKV